MKKEMLILSGHYPVSNWQAQTNHHLASSQAGIDYRHMSHCTYATIPYMHKIAWIKEVLGMYEFVFWIDDDSFFTGVDREDFERLSQNKLGFFLSGRGGYDGLVPPINSCFFGLSNAPQSFELLNKVEELSNGQIQKLWDQKDGKQYGGDQDRLWLVLKHHFPNEIKSKQFSLLSGVEFNGRFSDFLEASSGSQPKILHLTGRNNIKWKSLRKLESGPTFEYGLIPIVQSSQYPLIRRGHHRILASRLAQQPIFERISKWLPSFILEKFGATDGRA